MTAEEEQVGDCSLHTSCIHQRQQAWRLSGPGWTFKQINREETFEKEIQPETKFDSEKKHGEGNLQVFMCYT